MANETKNAIAYFEGEFRPLADAKVNVMTHAMRARKERGAKIVVIDIYDNDTMKQADMALCLRPGTDENGSCAGRRAASAASAARSASAGRPAARSAEDRLL